MRRNQIRSGMRTFQILAVLALVFLFSCKKPDDTPVRGTSNLHILGAAENKDTFNLNFDYFNVDNVVIANFYNRRNWPMTGYAPLEEGGTPDKYGNGRIYLVGIKPSYFVNQTPDTVLFPRAIELVKDEKSTLCIADSAGFLAVVKFKDVYFTPDTGFAQIRLINLDETVTIGSISSTNGVITTASIRFLEATPFISVPPGTYDFVLKNDTLITTIGTLNGVHIPEKAVYSFYLNNITGSHVLDSIRH